MLTLTSAVIVRGTTLARPTPPSTIASTASGANDEETTPIVTHDHQAGLPSAASGARWGRSFHSLAIMLVHNRRLFDLATRNSQRLEFQRVCASVSSELRHFLESQTKLFHPQTPEAVKYAISQLYRLHSGKEAPGVAEVLETANEQKATLWFDEKAKELSVGDYFLWFGKAYGLTFEGESEWVPELPILELLGPAPEELTEMASVARGHAALVRHDGGAAVVMDSHSGFLPAEPSRDEVIYELAYWNDRG